MLDKTIKGRTLVRMLITTMMAATLALGVAPASAQQVNGGGNGWSAAPGTVGDNSIVGSIDSPGGSTPVGKNSDFAVSGWAVDTEAQGWGGIDQVQVWQGLMGAGGSQLASGQVALNRPDVAQAFNNGYWAASGFVAIVPAASNTLAPGATTLNAYVHAPGKGWFYRPVSFTVGTTQTPSGGYGADPLVVIEKPTVNENVGVSNNTFTIQGYALDRNATAGSQGVGVDQVSVYIGGPRSENGVLLGTTKPNVSDPLAASYGPQFANAGWQVQFTPTTYSDGGQTLYVYAHSSVTGKTTLATQTFNIVEGVGN